MGESDFEYLIKWSDAPGSQRQRSCAERDEAMTLARAMAERAAVARSAQPPHPFAGMLEREDHRDRLITDIRVVTLRSLADGSTTTVSSEPISAWRDLTGGE